MKMREKFTKRVSYDDRFHLLNTYFYCEGLRTEGKGLLASTVITSHDELFNTSNAHQRCTTANSWTRVLFTLGW